MCVCVCVVLRASRSPAIVRAPINHEPKTLMYLAMLQIVLVLAIVLAPIRPHVYTMSVHFVFEVVSFVSNTYVLGFRV